MNSKQLNIVLGVIILVLLGVIVFTTLKKNPRDQILTQSNNITNTKQGQDNVAQPSKDANAAAGMSNQESAQSLPADWKVYTNSKYKFSIGYPKNWFVIDSSSGALSISKTQSCKSDNAQSQEQFTDQFRDCERFTVWAGDPTPANFTDITDDNYFKVNIGGIEGQKFIYNLAQQFSVDGQQFYIPRATIDAEVKKNGVWYKFSMVFHQQNINRAIKEFDSFVNSFKFLEK